MFLVILKDIFKIFFKKIYIISNLFLLILIASVAKVTAQNNLDLTTLKGTWKGTITESLANSTKKTTYPITIIFNDYDSGKFKTDQIYK